MASSSSSLVLIDLVSYESLVISKEDEENFPIIISVVVVIIEEPKDYPPYSIDLLIYVATHGRGNKKGGR